MSKIGEQHLLAGIIFGDTDSNEYLYLPAGEVGMSPPLCVLEQAGRRDDVSLEKAGHLIDKLTLKPVAHPLLGKRSF